MTTRELTKREPRLRALMADCKREHERARSQQRYCANAAWYGGGLRARLVSLVGWSAERDDPILRSSAAYDIAYDRLCAALPDCHGCPAPFCG